MAKSDAPNYRKATDEKTCGSCKAWDSSATPDPMTGYCEWYDFNCRADHTCDAWAASDFEKAWSVVKEENHARNHNFSYNPENKKYQSETKCRFCDEPTGSSSWDEADVCEGCA